MRRTCFMKISWRMINAPSIFEEKMKKGTPCEKRDDRFLCGLRVIFIEAIRG